MALAPASPLDRRPVRHKTINLKTTLDLPPDVAHTLRMESARRVGRKAASITKLVSDAVRKTYGEPPTPKKTKIDLTPGRAVLKAPAGSPLISSADIRAALEDL